MLRIFYMYSLVCPLVVLIDWRILFLFALGCRGSRRRRLLLRVTLPTSLEFFNVLETGLLVRIPRSELGTEFSLDVLDCDNLSGVVGGHRGPA